MLAICRNIRGLSQQKVTKLNLEATEASIGRSGERICVIKVKLSGNKVELNKVGLKMMNG